MAWPALMPCRPHGEEDACDACTVQVKRIAKVDFQSRAEIEWLVDAMAELGAKALFQVRGKIHDHLLKAVPEFCRPLQKSHENIAEGRRT